MHTSCGAYAIVPAAGSGRRFGGPVKKQFLLLNGKEILIRTLETLASVPEIRGILLEADEADLPQCRALVQQYAVPKIHALVAGGATRQESVLRALQQLPEGCDIVVIHDGARPLVKPGLIQESIAGARAWGGAVAAVPVKDTIKEADEQGFIRRTPLRSSLWNAQTPQTFQAAPLREAYQKALAAGDFSLTDDSQVVEKYGELSVRLIPGEYENLKITTPEDLLLADRILSGSV